MCDVCGLAREASAYHAGLLRSGARERLARRASEQARAANGDTPLERPMYAAGRRIGTMLYRLFAAISRPRLSTE